MAHHILTTHPDTGEPGIYLEGEIAGLAGPLWINKTDFPAVGGGSEATKIANLEADLAVMFDAAMPPGTTQRLRVHITSLVPLVYVLGTFASEADISPTWWGGP